MSVAIPSGILKQTKFALREAFQTGGHPDGPRGQFENARWVAAYDTVVGWPRADVQDLLDFLEAQKDGAGTFWGYDWTRPFGHFYTADPTTMTRAAGAGGGAFDGTADTISALSTTTIGVTGMPASYRFQKSDRVGLALGSRRWLGRVTTNVTCSTGGAGTVTVYPPVPTSLFTTSSTFTVRRAEAVMRIVPGSTRVETDNGMTSIGFEAVQKFYA